MGKTSGGRDASVRSHRVNCRRESGVSWGRRARGVGGGGRGAGSAGAWRRRERLAQSRRPMEILTSLYALLSGGQGINPKIDSLAFRLHCGATTAALLAASAALTTRHLVGNPIDCIHTRDIPEDVLNTYCWIHSTFTVAGEAGAYPGVRPAGAAPRRYGKYYQWVAFMLFLQGTNELTSLIESNYRHPWTLATLEELQMRCRPLLPVAIRPGTDKSGNNIMLYEYVQAIETD